MAITVTHPICEGAPNCHAALAATSYGLFYTETLVYDDDSNPVWEYIGYAGDPADGDTVNIAQFSYYHTSPLACQVCLGKQKSVLGVNAGFVRTPSTETWTKIIDEDIISTVLVANGYEAGGKIRMGWIECWPPANIYVTVIGGYLPGTKGAHYFFKSTDNGATWKPIFLYEAQSPNRWPNSIAIQRGSGGGYSAGQIIFIDLDDRPPGWSISQYPGILVSRDMGESWEPKDDEGKPSPFWQGASDPRQQLVASDTYADQCYGAHKIGGHWGEGYTCVRYDNWCTVLTDKDAANNQTGWSNLGAVALDGNDLYTGQSITLTDSDRDIWYTHNIEAASPTWQVRRALPPNHRVRALYIEPLAGLLVGAIADSTGWATNPLIGHVIQTATSDWTMHGKAGANIWSRSRLSGSIYFRTQIAINGLVSWDIPDGEEIIPPDMPSGVGWSGFPIWINAQARELRADPSWDRLYVMSETVWPDGSGLWNQPILFQFVLSGYVGANLLENEGRLAFIPTFAQGQISVYSGSINYTGLLEAHVNAPLVHGVVVVGKFAVDDQVRYTDDITLATGILLGMWDIVGVFGESRVTSIDSEIVIENDVTITYADTLDQPVDTDPTPWDWSSLNDLPFDVNCQYRDSYLWVGAEKAGIAQPIRRTLLVSGSDWQERGGGLPEVPITDIDGGN